MYPDALNAPRRRSPQTRQWLNNAGAPKFKKLQEEYSHPHLETVGPKLRAMFSWNNAEAKDKDETESFNGKIARTQVQ